MFLAGGGSNRLVEPITKSLASKNPPGISLIDNFTPPTTETQRFLVPVIPNLGWYFAYWERRGYLASAPPPQNAVGLSRLQSTLAGGMSIQEELASELREAMRARDRRRLDVIRMVESEISRAKSEPAFKGKVDDQLYARVIGEYCKKMDKARREYVDLGERGQAMAEKLGFEVDYLARWAPSKLGEAETRQLVDSAIAELGASGAKDAGKVIGHLLKIRQADLDGALVNRLVRAALAE